MFREKFRRAAAVELDTARWFAAGVLDGDGLPDVSGGAVRTLDEGTEIAGHLVARAARSLLAGTLVHHAGEAGYALTPSASASCRVRR